MSLRCPKCSTLTVFDAGGKLKVRTRMLVITKSTIDIVCRKCGSAVPLDLELGAELRKALDMPPTRLVIRKSAETLDAKANGK